ncbi:MULTISPECIES: ABC transporter ATP-binding protein [Oligella]|uniref:Polyamine ABC transporter ATPase n=2 Tax=Oligella urethralis TaxID=90245 RepID=A0A096A9B9_9BURK|nr:MULTISPECIES: ABC transporter ATP-binding protein [Oligella]KGF27282.1 polyamine ABC transporter ATPase [Oligella urethralis DNF00040]MDK6202852.1 ABC transporter ATP-binding protein [Oligella urethralis]OFS87085.1 Fe3+/spermidine/putrescine ABC transporter ATP-binding protein [Oligella sp. HMSC05A10]OFV50654.1 Fe3+/spermidine/putrescine ABC transporter ATP-binding protein [Oligella sp. HMSC09E12]WOS38692.1 Sulfate/thiosulfate import ATP-binding protein CysA [Oligella urethralis]
MEHFDKVRIQIKSCQKTYSNGTIGLKTTSIEVEPGEILALLGPSGCGKTTLLRMVAGLEDADRGGEIWFGNQNVTMLPIEKRNVGMVFQHYALFPQMTVEANIAYGLKIRKLTMDQIKARVADLVRLMNLNGLEKRRPHELSGGQRQRVALARAVAIRPRVLLLDEPLAALDAKLKESLRDELGVLLRELGITAIYVTHDQQEAMALADRLAIMYKGEIVQRGSSETLYREPSHPFVAEFLGRVNRLTRTVEQAQKNHLLLGHYILPCAPQLQGHTSLLIRPDDIQLSEEIVPEKARATIKKRIFLGDRIQFILCLPGDQLLKSETSTNSIFREGQEVALTIQSDKIMAAIQE